MASALKSQEVLRNMATRGSAALNLQRPTPKDGTLPVRTGASSMEKPVSRSQLDAAIASVPSGVTRANLDAAIAKTRVPPRARAVTRAPVPRATKAPQRVQERVASEKTRARNRSRSEIRVVAA